MLQQPAEEWIYLTEAAQIIEATDERESEAELLHRVPGDPLNAAGDRSERHYRQAIAVAERQNAKLLQLKASASLALARPRQALGGP